MLTGNTYEITYNGKDFDLTFTIKVTYQKYLPDYDGYEYDWEVISDVVKDTVGYSETLDGLNCGGLTTGDLMEVDTYILDVLDKEMYELEQYLEDCAADDKIRG